MYHFCQSFAFYLTYKRDLARTVLIQLYLLRFVRLPKGCSVPPLPPVPEQVTT